MGCEPVGLALRRVGPAFEHLLRGVVPLQVVVDHVAEVGLRDPEAAVDELEQRPLAVDADESRDLGGLDEAVGEVPAAVQDPRGVETEGPV